MTFEYAIRDELGIHARPAGLIVSEAKKYSSVIEVECKGKKADAKRIFALMSLGAKCGDFLRVTCTGEDEEAAAAGLKAVITENL